MNLTEKNKLLDAARETALRNPCCGYSHFTVGAAFLTKSESKCEAKSEAKCETECDAKCEAKSEAKSEQKIYTGFNVENYGIQSICAERTGAVSAMVDGVKPLDFEAVAIVGKRIDDESASFVKTLPCGYCRQFLLEYAGPDLNVITCDGDGNISEYRLGDLLPEAFSEF